MAEKNHTLRILIKDNSIFFRIQEPWNNQHLGQLFIEISYAHDKLENYIKDNTNNSKEILVQPDFPKIEPYECDSSFDPQEQRTEKESSTPPPVADQNKSKEAQIDEIDCSDFLEQTEADTENNEHGVGGVGEVSDGGEGGDTIKLEVDENENSNYNENEHDNENDNDSDENIEDQVPTDFENDFTIDSFYEPRVENQNIPPNPNMNMNQADNNSVSNNQEEVKKVNDIFKTE